MLKNKIRAVVPIVALVLFAACADSTGPEAPELAEIEQDSADQDPTSEVQGTEKKRKLPLEQERKEKER